MRLLDHLLTWGVFQNAGKKLATQTTTMVYLPALNYDAPLMEI